MLNVKFDGKSLITALPRPMFFENSSLEVQNVLSGSAL